MLFVLLRVLKDMCELQICPSCWLLFTYQGWNQISMTAAFLSCLLKTNLPHVEHQMSLDNDAKHHFLDHNKNKPKSHLC